MNKRTSKFKVGDKVRILPSVVNIGVSESEVGTIQTVIRIIDPETIDITTSSGGSWWVRPDQIECIIIKGQQLLFNFME